MITISKNHVSKIAALFIGVVVAVGASYAYAAFTDPAGTPPDRNMVIPINVTAVDQAKAGGLSVNTFIAAQDAVFDQQTFLTGLIRGGAPTSKNSMVSIGGIDNGQLQNVDTVVQGEVAAATLSSTVLRNSTMRKVCADSEGKIKLCFYGYVSGTVWESQNVHYESSYIGAPGTNGGGFSYQIAPLPGYTFYVTACLPVQYTTNRTVTVKWTDPNTGQQYQTTVTVPSGDECTYWWNAANVSGPSTGNAAPVTDICVIPGDPAAPVDPSQQC